MIRKIKADNAFFKHKWLLIFVFLIFMALSASTINYVRATDNVNPSFFELILEQSNEPQMILFPFMYLLLLFTINGDPVGTNKKMPAALLKDAALSSLIYMLFFITANLIYGLLALNINSFFNNVWSYTGPLSRVGLSPLALTLISVLLLFMRYCFMVYLISFINTLTRKPHWGFWSAFIISYIDFMLYLLLLIPYPLNILPIEHTRITYTEAYVPDFNNTGVRVPYYVSVLYWLGLIAVIYIALILVYRKRRKDEERVR